MITNLQVQGVLPIGILLDAGIDIDFYPCSIIGFYRKPTPDFFYPPFHVVNAIGERTNSGHVKAFAVIMNNYL
jgi:hypothetical protein